MPRMFGTDGVRGLANRALTAQLALDLGDAAVRVLGDDGDKSEFDGRRRALVGRDTRVSGDFLAAALSAGMSAGGFDVIDAGIIPTPGVAYLTSVLNVEMGAVISASHNPMPDNGIKFFARGGFKLPDTKEDEIENVLGQDWERPTGAGVGRISHDTATATNLYIDHLVSTIAPIGPDKSQPTPLKGLKSWLTAPTAPPPWSRRKRCAAQERRDRDQRFARRLQHQQERRIHTPRTAAGHGQSLRSRLGRGIRR
mgnify:CR=1 FL=1